MQCVTHSASEARQVCYSCGKPICAACDEQSHGFCERCAPPERPGPEPAPDPLAAVPPGPRRNAALAALFSFVPGMGQIYNGDTVKGLTIIVVLALLTRGAVARPPLFILVTMVWFYQVFEAFHAAASRRRPALSPALSPPRPGDAVVAWSLVGAGALLTAENATGALLPHLWVVLPAMVILAGFLLILSYFRAPERTAP